MLIAMALETSTTVHWMISDKMLYIECETIRRLKADSVLVANPWLCRVCVLRSIRKLTLQLSVKKTCSLAKNYGFGLKLRTEWLSLTVCFRAENGGANDLDVLVFLQLISQNKTSSQPCSKSLEGCVDRGRMEFWQMHGKQRCGVFEPKWLQGNWYLFKSASWTNKLAMYINWFRFLTLHSQCFQLYTHCCMKYKTTFCWFTIHLYKTKKESIREIDEKIQFSWSIRNLWPDILRHLMVAEFEKK